MPSRSVSPAFLAAAVVVACVIGALWRAIPGDLVFFQRDILAYWVPHITVFQRAVLAGDMPLWNAFVGFGAPLLAEPSCGLLYPPTWLVFILEPADYYRLFVIGHAVLAGMGASVLARRLGTGSFAAAVGGGVYAVSGPLLSAASLFHHFAGAAWMPWVLAGFISVCLRPSCRTAAGLSVAVAGQLLAGSADLCLMTALLGVLWLAWNAIGRRGILDRRFALFVLLGLAIGAAIGSAQWALTFDITREGVRGSLPLAARSYWSVHPASLVELFTPQLLARLPLGEALRGALFEGREPLLASLFLGVPALGLAAFGVSASGSASRSRGFALTALATMLFLSLGYHTPAFAATHWLPPFSFIRFPAKYLLPLALSWAVLVALGCEAWRGAWQDRERRTARIAMIGLSIAAVWLAGVAVVLRHPSWFPVPGVDLLRGPSAPGLSAMLVAEALIATLAVGLVWFRLRGALRTDLLLGAMAALALVDLAVAGQAVNTLAARTLVATAPPLARAIPEGSRFHLAEASLRDLQRWFEASALRSLGRVGSALAALEMLQPPQATRFGLFGSYDGDFTGLAPRLQSELAAVVHGHEDWPVGSQGLRLGGVDYVVDFGRGLQGFEEVARLESSLGIPLRVLRVPDTRPRAYVVEGIRVVPDSEAVETVITLVNLSREAIVSEGAGPRQAEDGFVASARVTARQASGLVIEATANRPGLLVVLEAYRDGWTATVDGQPAPVLRANAVFRGVLLSAGPHRVEMNYRPRALGWAAAIGTLGLLALFILAVLSSRSGAREPKTAES